MMWPAPANRELQGREPAASAAPCLIRREPHEAESPCPAGGRQSGGAIGAPAGTAGRAARSQRLRSRSMQEDRAVTDGVRFRTHPRPMPLLPMRKDPRRPPLVRARVLGVAGVLAVLAVWIGFGWL